MKHSFLKKITLVLFATLSSLCYGQTGDDACRCEKMTKPERSILSVSDSQNDLELFYPDGKIKYKEVIKGKKDHITCYTSSGKKCKEIFMNSRTNIKKTIYYDEGKKYMVCKGSMKY